MVRFLRKIVRVFTGIATVFFKYTIHNFYYKLFYYMIIFVVFSVGNQTFINYTKKQEYKIIEMHLALQLKEIQLFENIRKLPNDGYKPIDIIDTRKRSKADDPGPKS